MDNLALSTCTPARLMAQPLGSISPMSSLYIEPSVRHELIAQAAYFLAKHRRFEPGHELEDWQAAEAEVDLALQIDAPARND
jgi:hypothetical protein